MQFVVVVKFYGFILQIENNTWMCGQGHPERGATGAICPGPHDLLNHLAYTTHDTDSSEGGISLLTAFFLLGPPSVPPSPKKQ